jgi:hypothetical protein
MVLFLSDMGQDEMERFIDIRDKSFGQKSSVEIESTNAKGLHHGAKPAGVPKV